MKNLAILLYTICMSVKIIHSLVNRKNEDWPKSIIEKTQPKIISIILHDKFKKISNVPVENVRTVFAEISAFGITFRIELNQSEKNVCQFRSIVNSERDMMGEFNLCHGLDGVFQWNSKIYFIKPSTVATVYPTVLSPGKQLLPHFIYFQTFSVKKTWFSCKLIDEKNSKRHIPTNFNHLPKLQRNKRESFSDYPVIDSDIVEEHKIELLIVVTSNFVKRFNGGLKQYILNNVAIATNLLRHPTINTSISIDIVDIIVLDKDFEEKHNLNDWSSLSQDHVVSRFCQWLQSKKRKLNYSWDSSILINDGYFSTNAIGIAHLGSICSDNNCLAVVDRGFGTGFIIAHELAHQMNARHDYDDVEACRMYEPKTGQEITYNTIMSTSLYFENYPFVWSTCSQYLINRFLRSKQSSCLKKENKKPNLYSHENIIKHMHKYSIGVEYDLNKQCSFAFGEPAEYCHSEHNRLKKCSILYCRIKKYPMCFRADAIIVDGTECDKNKHCIQGECVEKDRKIDPVDGGWSEYSQWSNCSRTCDGGVQFSHRICNNPVPSFGGKFCVGTKERIRSCNIERCTNPIDPREEACSKYNLKPYFPQNDEEFACNLVCITDNQTLKYDIKMTDGTPCSSLRSDICVKGTCFKTGCDRVVGSKKVFDNCHKCGGKNDTCVKRNGLFDGSNIFGVKMKTAFRVPANVTNLYIEKVSQRQTPYSEDVYDDFELLLIVDRSTVIRRSETIEPFGGGLLYYSGAKKNVEIIEIKGLIQKEIVVIIKMENQDTKLHLPTIQYYYYVPKEIFVWRHLEINIKLCKGFCNGFIEINPACFRESDNRRFMDHNCSDSSKPDSIIKSCHSLCGYRWERPEENYINEEIETSCPISCGKGKLKIHYLCKESNASDHYNLTWKTVNISYCLEALMTNRPYIEANCNDPCIPPMWSYGNWEKCPVECGTSFRSRSFRCVDDSGTFNNAELCIKYLGMPEDKQPCLSFINCQNQTRWMTSDWSKCSETCDSGTQNRTVSCFRWDKDKPMINEVINDQFLKDNEQISDSFCQIHQIKPNYERSCQLDSCYTWVLNEKSKCSVTCGSGYQIQNFVCKEKAKLKPSDAVFDDGLCIKRNLTKPEPIISLCIKEECPVNSFWISKNWTACSTSCGGGIQHRGIYCAYKNKNGTVKLWSDNNYCQNFTKPQTVKKCQSSPCPIWVYGLWSECKGNCLYGRQYRTVKCFDLQSNKIFPQSNCNVSEMNPNFKQCLLSKLCGFWKVGSWSQCSVSCGLGIKTRNVACHHFNGIRSSNPKMCVAHAPLEEVLCQNSVCKDHPSWWLMNTSECYGNDCNPGIIYANVKCINYKFEILNETICRTLRRPDYYAGCINKRCKQYFWKAEPWENIPSAGYLGYFGCLHNSCTVTGRIRNVNCEDDYGQVYEDSFCDELVKPDVWRLCPVPRQCSDVPRSCKELKEIQPNAKDGEYKLVIDLNLAYLIYCADMNTDDPKEYLTLKELNYARSSRFISTEDKGSCIYHEELEYEQSCPGCTIDESLRSITYYDKIRINMIDLTVDVMDNRFSMTNGPSYIPYATAKDCAGLVNCPKGHFKINLKGTGFSVSMKTEWHELYSKYEYRIWRSQSSQIVEGWCGGNCSGCSPVGKLYIEPQMFGRDYEVKSKDVL